MLRRSGNDERLAFVTFGNGTANSGNCHGGWENGSKGVPGGKRCWGGLPVRRAFANRAVGSKSGLVGEKPVSSMEKRLAMLTVNNIHAKGNPPRRQTG
jgi:hypothetical protein